MRKPKDKGRRRQRWTMRIAVLGVVLWVVAMAMVGVCDVVRSELNCDEARRRAGAGEQRRSGGRCAARKAQRDVQAMRARGA
jgi:hypothetical protein